MHMSTCHRTDEHVEQGFSIPGSARTHLLPTGTGGQLPADIDGPYGAVAAAGLGRHRTLWIAVRLPETHLFHMIVNRTRLTDVNADVLESCRGVSSEEQIVDVRLIVRLHVDQVTRTLLSSHD